MFLFNGSQQPWRNNVFFCISVGQRENSIAWRKKGWVRWGRFGKRYTNYVNFLTIRFHTAFTVFFIVRSSLFWHCDEASFTPRMETSAVGEWINGSHMSVYWVQFDRIMNWQIAGAIKRLEVQRTEVFPQHYVRHSTLKIIVMGSSSFDASIFTAF